MDHIRLVTCRCVVEFLDTVRERVPDPLDGAAQLSSSVIAALPCFRSQTRDTHTQIFELASR